MPRVPSRSRETKELPLLGVAAVLLFLLCLAGHADESGKEKVPVWSIDLKEYGYRDGEIKVQSETLTVWPKQRGITFTNADVLVAYFLIHQPPTKLSVRGHPQASDPFQLRGVFLDAATGALRHKQDWPTNPNLHSEILPTYAGKFVVRTGDLLTLYSSSFEPLRKLTLPSEEKKKPKYWDVQISPTGQFLFLKDWDYPEEHMFRLNSDSFEQLDTWNEKGTQYFAFADNALAGSSDHQPIWFRTIGQSGRTLYLIDPYCAAPEAFINNSSLVVDVCEGIVVLSTRGQIVFRDQFPEDYRKYWLERAVRTSRDGWRFVVSLGKIKGGFFDTPIYVASLRVIVYDLRFRSRIYSVEFKRLRKRVLYDFALSPDGQWLGIMVGTEVHVYRLPSPAQP